MDDARGSHAGGESINWIIEAQALNDRRQPPTHRHPRIHIPFIAPSAHVSGSDSM
jgi:hypothetical protein